MSAPDTPPAGNPTAPLPVLLSPLISAKVLADSISEVGVRITTMELVYPRFVHAELMTHRVFSRNASSSRAIPVQRALKMIRDRPALPVSWRMNQSGMQGYEVASLATAHEAEGIWLTAMSHAINAAEKLDALGLHKQIVNRLTEPFSHIKVVLTSVWWDNWDGLRNHHMAEPTIEALAIAIKEARDASEPALLKTGEWHLPYITDEDRATQPLDNLIKMSAARCARVSYNNHDGKPTTFEADIKLHDALLVAQPIHASPAEHQACPDERNKRNRWANPHRHGNLTGWCQYRKFLSNETLDQAA